MTDENEIEYPYDRPWQKIKFKCQYCANLWSEDRSIEHSWGTGGWFGECPSCCKQTMAIKVMCPCGEQVVTSATTSITCAQCSATLVIRNEITRSASCVYCGDPAEQVDHIRPRSHGGIHDHINLVPACTPCNSNKGKKLLTEWAEVDPDKVARGIHHCERVHWEWCALFENGGIYQPRHTSRPDRKRVDVGRYWAPECMCAECSKFRLNRGDMTDVVSILDALRKIILCAQETRHPWIGDLHGYNHSNDSLTYSEYVRDIMLTMMAEHALTVTPDRSDYWKGKLIGVLYGYSDDGGSDVVRKSLQDAEERGEFKIDKLLPPAERTVTG